MTCSWGGGGGNWGDHISVNEEDQGRLLPKLSPTSSWNFDRGSCNDGSRELIPIFHNPHEMQPQWPLHTFGNFINQYGPFATRSHRFVYRQMGNFLYFANYQSLYIFCCSLERVHWFHIICLWKCKFMAERFQHKLHLSLPATNVIYQCIDVLAKASSGDNSVLDGQIVCFINNYKTSRNHFNSPFPWHFSSPRQRGFVCCVTEDHVGLKQAIAR